MGFGNAMTLCVVAVSFLMAAAFGMTGGALRAEDMERVVHRLDGYNGRPSGVVWVVQLSDLHLSVFYTERARALQKLMGTILATIQPSLVLVTGDLTDAKRKGGPSTQQYEEEWITYENTINLISNESRIPLNLFYDLRGNHDKYGVPYANSSLDYYSRYSCNARQNRMGLVQSITLLDDSDWKSLFVGVDDSMSVGLRGPSNLFGHPSDIVIANLDRELSQWDNDTSGPVTKIVFGHFPTSFTASSETGHRSDEIMSKHNISAYICGHLHCKFGRQLYKHHMTKMLGEFWEWEMGDWRTSRMMRVLAIDHGRVSFVDVDLRQMSKDVLNGKQFVTPTIILPTNPLDSRVMLRSSPGLADTAGPIRALVFSKSRPTSVTASVFDSVTHSFVDYVLMETLKMYLVSGPSTKERDGPFFYEAMWDSRNYTDSSATRYWLQIQVVEKGGGTTTSRMWPFSVEGTRGPFSLNFMGYVAMGIEWEAFYPIILWTTVCVVLGGLLVLPRLVFLYLERNGIYDRWAYSIFNPPSGSTFPYFKLPLWALLEGARNRYLWWGQVLYISFLLAFPWFWGRVLADDYPIGYMSLWGWTVWPSKGTVAHQSGLGLPDIMGIVLPYMCAVVLPLVLMVSALCAERAACELVEAAATGHRPAGVMTKRVEAKKTNGGGAVHSSISSGRHVNGNAGGEDARPLLEDQEGASESEEEELETAMEEEMEEEEEEARGERSMWRFMDRKVRKVYFVGCFVLGFSHLRLCLFLASAYGAQSVFLSPIYVWAVPTLIVASIFMTSHVKPRISLVN